MSKSISLEKRLYRSHLTIAGAGVGVVFLMAIIVFKLINQTQELSEVRIPRLAAFSNTVFALHEAQMELEAWQDTKDEKFIELRNDVWQTKVWPNFDKMLLALDRISAEEQEELYTKFRDIEEWQKRAELAAHLPGNNRLRYYWQSNVKETAQFIINQITAFINIEARIRSGGRRKMLFRHAADFRAHFSQLQTILLEYVENQNETTEQRFLLKFKVTNETLADLLSEKKLFRKEQLLAMNLLYEKLESYKKITTQLKELNSSQNLNYAKDLMAHRLQPAILEIEKYFEKNIKQEQRAVDRLRDSLKKTQYYAQLLIIFCILGLATVAIIFARRITGKLMSSITELRSASNRINKGDLSQRIEMVAEREIEELAKSFDSMRVSLKRNQDEQSRINLELDTQNKYRTRMSLLVDQLQGFLELDDIAGITLLFFTKEMKATLGVIYFKDESDHYNFARSYGVDASKIQYEQFQIGTGILGTVALDKKFTKFNADEYNLKAETSLLNLETKEFIIVPLVYNNVSEGVLELGFNRELTDLELEFLEDVSEQIALAVVSNSSRLRTERLLEVSQRQSAELEAHQNAILQSNAELEEKSEELRAQSSQLEATNVELEEKSEELRAQSDQLKLSNQELEEKSEELRVQSEVLQDQNKDLEKKSQVLEKQKQQIELAKKEVEENASRLEEASRYKSEFLANMSHELRTPLNSLLILSRAFADNEDGNLTEDQVEAGKIIHGGGTELLNLINDLLDLSKVEAGQLDFYFSKVAVNGLVSSVSRIVKPMIEQKGLKFIVELAPDLPEEIVTDPKRVEQILKNLLSNASKFTHEGSITIQVANLDSDQVKVTSPELQARDCVTFSVIDTGIGIPEEKQEAIFEAFKQADGTTTREYGGTGLGLSISREFSQLLHGEMHLKSTVGKGSSFILVLPVVPIGEEVVQSNGNYGSDEHVKSAQKKNNDKAGKLADKPELVPLEPISKYLDDDRDNLNPEKKTILIVEDDRVFAHLILKRTQKMGFQVVAVSNSANGLYMAKKIKPDGILTDMGLPDVSGDILIDHLHKVDGLENVPVYILSARDWIEDEVLKKSVGFIKKPVTSDQIDELLGSFTPNEESKILIYQNNIEDRLELEKLLKSFNCKLTLSDSLEDCLSCMKNEIFNMIIIDLDSEDRTHAKLSQTLDENYGNSFPKIVIYSDRITSNEDLKQLEKITSSIILKGAESQSRLLDDISMFFHDLNPTERKKPQEPTGTEKAKTNVNQGSAVLIDKRVLLVDDDIRNTFAVGKLLKKEGLKVVMADNGEAAIKKLKAADDPFDIILMDMMMPIMDGYEAMEKIREERKYKKLPIIALTAKAMPEDRQKCIDSGANDYLSKPVNTEKLLSLIRVWVS